MSAPVLYRLVTLEEAKDHLSIRPTQTADDTRIGQLVIDASQAVMDYIGAESVSLEGWTDTDGNPLVYANGDPERVGAQGAVDSDGNFVFDEDTDGNPIDPGISIIPGPVRRATLLLIGRANEDREGVSGDPFEITGAVASLLARFRDIPV